MRTISDSPDVVSSSGPSEGGRPRLRIAPGGRVLGGRTASEIEWNRLIKELHGRSFEDGIRRVMDVVVSLTTLAVLSPIFLIIGIFIKIDSRGPVLYRQVRVGHDRRFPSSDEEGGRRTGDLAGAPFVIYKFRTMYHRAERESGLKWADDKDDRVTRVGRILRDYSIDELPQLLNVLKGDMSLVGPRPERPGFVNQLRSRIPGYLLRHQVKPGMTGWAQVHQGGDRTLEDVRRKVRYDLQYIRNRSLWVDLKILLMTPLAVAGFFPDDPSPSLIDAEWTDRSEEGSAAGRSAERTRFDEMPPGSGKTASMEESVSWSAGRLRQEKPLLLVASDRDWLVTALEEIFEPAGIRTLRATHGEMTLRLATSDAPSFIIVDESLPQDEAVDVCRELASRRVPPHVPIVLYSSSVYARSEKHARALDAGAWTILREPLQAGSLIAMVRRLLSIGNVVSRNRTDNRFVDPDTGLLTLSGLRRVLPRVGALAVRNDAPVSCVALSPTRVADLQNLDSSYRIAAAELCSPNIRTADICAWGNSTEILIVAYDTPVEGARQLVNRLNHMAREDGFFLGSGDVLSAGVVELKPRDGLKEVVEPRDDGDFTDGLSSAKFEDLYSLTAAQDALRRARDAGGGVEVAEVA